MGHLMTIEDYAKEGIFIAVVPDVYKLDDGVYNIFNRCLK